MTYSFRLTLRVLATLAIAAVATVPRPVSSGTPAMGQFTEVRGEVRVARGRELPTRISTLHLLAPGDTITVAPGAAARVVVYATGACFQLDGGAVALAQQATLKRRSGPLPRNYSQLPQNLARFAGETRSALGALIARNPPGSMGPRTLTPTGAARDSEVVLRWEGDFPDKPGAQAAPRLIIVQVMLTANRKVLVTEELPLTAREFRLPRDLLQGNSSTQYTWSVTARGPFGSLVAERTFRVLSVVERSALTAAEKAAESVKPEQRDDPAVRLLLARVYERFDLPMEAIREYLAALARRPDDTFIQAEVTRVEFEMLSPKKSVR